MRRLREAAASAATPIPLCGGGKVPEQPPPPQHGGHKCGDAIPASAEGAGARGGGGSIGQPQRRQQLLQQPRSFLLAVMSAAWALVSCLLMPPCALAFQGPFVVPTATRMRHASATGHGSLFVPPPTHHALASASRRPRNARGAARPLQMFNSGILNVGTPEVALILLVGYFVLGPQDLYKVAKETGQLISNLQSAGGDAWKVFQEAMEAEGTMQAMGAGIAEVSNLRQNFFQKFLDVRAERTLEQLEEKGVDVDLLPEEDEWSARIKERAREKRLKEEAGQEEQQRKRGGGARDLYGDDDDFGEDDNDPLLFPPGLPGWRGGGGRRGERKGKGKKKAAAAARGMMMPPYPYPPPPPPPAYYMRPPPPPPGAVALQPPAAGAERGQQRQQQQQGGPKQQPGAAAGWPPYPPPPPPPFFMYRPPAMPFYPPPTPPPGASLEQGKGGGQQLEGPSSPSAARPPFYPPPPPMWMMPPPPPPPPAAAKGGAEAAGARRFTPPPPPPMMMPMPVPWGGYPPPPFLRAPAPAVPPTAAPAAAPAPASGGNELEMAALSPEEEAAQRGRFAAQLSGDWNKLVLERSANGANLPLPKGVPLEPAPASAFAAMATQGGGIVQEAAKAAARNEEGKAGGSGGVGDNEEKGRVGRWREGGRAERRPGRWSGRGQEDQQQQY